MDEYEYEYGSLHRPYCSTTAPRVRAEILHPLFVDRSGRPTLKIGHLTDLHVDVRADVYEENVKAWVVPPERESAASRSSRPTSRRCSPRSASTITGTRALSHSTNDAKQEANAILLTGDLIDYGRAHWGQDAARAPSRTMTSTTPDRNWFLFSYLLSSGDAYTKPVYTNLGNHDWRINPYPPFAVGAPYSKNFFYQGAASTRIRSTPKKKAQKLGGEARRRSATGGARRRSQAQVLVRVAGREHARAALSRRRGMPSRRWAELMSADADDERQGHACGNDHRNRWSGTCSQSTRFWTTRSRFRTSTVS